MEQIAEAIARFDYEADRKARYAEKMICASCFSAVKPWQNNGEAMDLCRACHRSTKIAKIAFGRAAIRVKNRHTYCTSYTVHINGRVIESFYDKKLAVECRNECNANFAW